MLKQQTPNIVKERLLKNINYLANGCWEWCGGVNHAGYGRFYVYNKEKIAHRTSYELFIGPIPDKSIITHSCKNKLCIRPEHLILMPDYALNQYTESQQPVIERFLSNTKITSDGCWEWTGRKNKKGYGRISIFGFTELAHRIAYKLFVGPILDGLHVLHKCDNPGCVRPKCLFLGTNTDNQQDMLKKGRGNKAKGARNHHAKLTDIDVIVIRNLY